jgi:hypothetical protein
MSTLNIGITPSGEIVGVGPLPLVGIPGTLSFGTAGVTIAAPQVVPLQPVPSQVLSITLKQQACTIKLTFKQLYVPFAAEIPTAPPIYGPINPGFLDLYVNGSLVIGGVICQVNNLIVRDDYLGFVGDLAFVDTQPPMGIGPQDPLPAGLGSRWLLTYWPLL